MKKLDDYSGEFRRDLKWEDFSSEALARALLATSRCVTGLDGYWYTLVRERFGEKIAGEMDAEIWSRFQMFVTRQIQKALNIYGDDLETLGKILQNSPDSIGVLQWDVEIKSKNYAIGTVTQCRSLDYFEKHDDMALLNTACKEVDAVLIPRIGEYVNPKIKITPIKLPPRKSKDEFCCQWEIRMEE